MGFSAEITEDEVDATVNPTDGTPVITAREVWLFKDDTNAKVRSQQARINFQNFTGIIPGSKYSEYQFATTRSVRAKKRSTRPPKQAWDVFVEYSTETQLVDDPVPANRRWKRSVSDTDQERHIIRDRNNKLIVDAAGTPFEGGVGVNVKLQSFVWRRIVDWANYDLNTKDLSGKINSDTFLGKPPGTLMLAYVGDEDWEGIYHIVHETFTIIFDPLGWKPKPVNAGLYELTSSRTGTGTIRQRIKDANNKDVTQPEPLTKDGKKVPDNLRPQECNFIEVDYYNPIPFGNLGLPTS